MNDVPHDLASSSGLTCEQMTKNQGTRAAILMAKGEYEELAKEDEQVDRDEL